MASIVYGGLDVHQKSISVCLLDSSTGEIIEQQIANDQEKVIKEASRWKKLGEVRVCYEASGAGFVVKRWLEAAGVWCDVIAPSLMPKAPGDRVKTDRRDAKKLATLYRAGLLTSVRCPNEQEETVRAIVRLRDEVTRDMTRSKNRASKYVQTLGHRYEGVKWTLKHRDWLGKLPLDSPQRFVLLQHLDEVDHLVKRRRTIDDRIKELSDTEPYREKVQRLMCLRGVGLYTAMVILTETGDARRFASAKAMMSYFGLVPRESSSGERQSRGSITKAGNSRVRWVLTEAAWNQTSRVGNSQRLRKQREGLSEKVVEISKKAERRLHDKYWKLAQRKDRRVAVTAVAREMVGFIWSLLTLEAA